MISFNSAGLLYPNVQNRNNIKFGSLETEMAEIVKTCTSSPSSSKVYRFIEDIEEKYVSQNKQKAVSALNQIKTFHQNPQNARSFSEGVVELCTEILDRLKKS